MLILNDFIHNKCLLEIFDNPYKVLSSKISHPMVIPFNLSSEVNYTYGVKQYIRMFMHIKLVKMGLVAFDRLKLAP